MRPTRLKGLRIFGTLDRLQIWHKLALLGLVFALLFAVPTTMLLRQVASGLAQSARELRGADAGEQALVLLQALSDHRALSAAALAGDAPAAAARGAARGKVDAGFAALADGKLDARADSPWVAAVEGWKALAAGVEKKVISPGDSNGSHVEVAANAAAALEAMLDATGLAADADSAIRHSARIAFLNVPALAEAMGQAEAQGIAYLAAKKAEAADRTALTGQLARVKERQSDLRAAVHKAMAQSVELQEVLAAPLQAADAGVDQAIKAIRVEVIFSQDLAAKPVDHHAAQLTALAAQHKLARSAVAEVRKLLETRRTQQRFEILVFVAAALAIFAGAIAFAVWTARSITRPLSHAVRVADGIAAGHLDHVIDERRAKNAEAARLLTAFRSMQSGLSDLMREVQSAGNQIRLASTQVASGNADLSERTEQQASSLEQTAATMEELASAVKSTTDNAARASGMVAQASEAAMRGSEAVSSAVTTMQEINEKSKRIVDIISVIDGIAFQTNILALNAAVEAARAGEQGRGFAVVATEVRSLAQRSAQAAKEIKGLIGEAVEASREGTRRVDESGKAMDDIMDSVQRVAAIFGEISSASGEQRNGIEQVEKAVSAMDRATQENAALVGEVAASAQSLEQQAGRLAELIARFRLPDAGPGTAETPPAGSGRLAAQRAPRSLPQITGGRR